MNIDEIKNNLMNLSHEELVEKILDLYCELNNLSHTEVRACCTPYYEYAITKESFNDIYNSIEKAFALCNRIVHKHLL